MNKYIITVKNKAGSKLTQEVETEKMLDLWLRAYRANGWKVVKINDRIVVR